MHTQTNKLSTLAGVVSIILWSTAIAFSRNVLEKLGVFTGGFYIFFFSGLFNLLIVSLKYKKTLIIKIREFPIVYYKKVGLFWIINQVFFLLAIGIATEHKDVVVIGIINYLWVGFTFMFSAILLKTRVRKFIMTLGIIFATLGTAIAIFRDIQ